jgi:hypothetical protein
MADNTIYLLEADVVFVSTVDTQAISNGEKTYDTRFKITKRVKIVLDVYNVGTENIVIKPSPSDLRDQMLKQSDMPRDILAKGVDLATFFPYRFTLIALSMRLDTGNYMVVKLPDEVISKFSEPYGIANGYKIYKNEKTDSSKINFKMAIKLMLILILHFVRVSTEKVRIAAHGGDFDKEFQKIYRDYVGRIFSGTDEDVYFPRVEEEQPAAIDVVPQPEPKKQKTKQPSPSPAKEDVQKVKSGSGLFDVEEYTGPAQPLESDIDLGGEGYQPKVDEPDIELTEEEQAFIEDQLEKGGRVPSDLAIITYDDQKNALVNHNKALELIRTNENAEEAFRDAVIKKVYDNADIILEENMNIIDETVKQENLALHGTASPEYDKIAKNLLEDFKTNDPLAKTTAREFVNKMGLDIVTFSSISATSKVKAEQLRLPMIMRENKVRFAFLKYRGSRSDVDFKTFQSVAKDLEVRLPRSYFSIVDGTSLSLFDHYFVDSNRHISNQLNGARQNSTAAYVNEYRTTESEYARRRIANAFAKAFATFDLTYQIKPEAVDELRTKVNDDASFRDFYDVVFGYLSELQNSVDAVNPYGCKYDEEVKAVVASNDFQTNLFLGVCPGYAVTYKYLKRTALGAFVQYDDSDSKPLKAEKFKTLRRNKVIYTCCSRDADKRIMFLCTDPFYAKDGHYELLDEFKPRPEENETESPFVFMHLDMCRTRIEKSEKAIFPNARLVVTSEGVLAVVTIKDIKKGEPIYIETGFGEDNNIYKEYNETMTPPGRENAEKLLKLFDDVTMLADESGYNRKMYDKLVNPMVLMMQLDNAVYETKERQDQPIVYPGIVGLILYEQLNDDIGNGNKMVKSSVIAFSKPVRVPTKREQIRKVLIDDIKQKYKFLLPGGFQVESRSLSDREHAMDFAVKNSLLLTAGEVIEASKKNVKFSDTDKMRLHSIMSRIASYYDDLCIKVKENKISLKNVEAGNQYQRSARSNKLLEVVADMPERYWPLDIQIVDDKPVFIQNDVDHLCRQIDFSLRKYRKEFYSNSELGTNVSFAIDALTASGSVSKTNKNVPRNNILGNYDARLWNVDERKAYLEYARANYEFGRSTGYNIEDKHSVYLESEEGVYCPTDILGKFWNDSATKARAVVPTTDPNEANVAFLVSDAPYLILMSTKDMKKDQTVSRLAANLPLLVFGFRNSLPHIYDRIKVVEGNTESGWELVISSAKAEDQPMITEEEIAHEDMFKAALLINPELVPAAYFDKGWDAIINPEVKAIIERDEGVYGSGDRTLEKALKDRPFKFMLHSLQQVVIESDEVRNDPKVIKAKQALKDQMFPSTKQRNHEWFVQVLTSEGVWYKMNYPVELIKNQKSQLQVIKYLESDFKNLFIKLMENEERQKQFNIEADPVMYMDVYTVLRTHCQYQVNPITSDSDEPDDLELNIRAFLLSKMVDKKFIAIKPFLPYELYRLNNKKKKVYELYRIEQEKNKEKVAELVLLKEGEKRLVGSQRPMNQKELAKFEKYLEENNIKLTAEEKTAQAIVREDFDEKLFEAINSLVIGEIKNNRRLDTTYVLKNTLYFVELFLSKLKLEETFVNLYEYNKKKTSETGTEDPETRKTLEELKIQVEKYGYVIAPKGYKLTHYNRTISKHGKNAIVTEDELKIKVKQLQMAVEAKKYVQTKAEEYNKLLLKYEKTGPLLLTSAVATSTEIVNADNDDDMIAGKTDILTAKEQRIYDVRETDIIFEQSQQQIFKIAGEKEEPEEEPEEEEDEEEKVVDVTGGVLTTDELYLNLTQLAKDVNEESIYTSVIEEKLVSAYDEAYDLKNKREEIKEIVSRKRRQEQEAAAPPPEIVDVTEQTVVAASAPVEQRRKVRIPPKEKKDEPIQNYNPEDLAADMINNPAIAKRHEEALRSRMFGGAKPSEAEVTKKKPSRKVAVTQIATSNGTFITQTTQVTDDKGIARLDFNGLPTINDMNNQVSKDLKIDTQKSTGEQPKEKTYNVIEIDDEDDEVIERQTGREAFIDIDDE